MYSPLDIARHFHKQIQMRLTLTRCRRRGVAPASLVRAASIWKQEKYIFQSFLFIRKVQSSQFTATRALEIYGLLIRADISWSGRIAITFFEVTSVARANISSAITG